MREDSSVLYKVHQCVDAALKESFTWCMCVSFCGKKSHFEKGLLGFFCRVSFWTLK